MKQFPRIIILKEEVRVTIRPLVKEDVDRLMAFFNGMPASDRAYLRTDVRDRGMLEDRLEGPTDRNVFRIVANTDDGSIVAEGTLTHPRYGWTSHVGEIRLIVAREFQRKGLASIMARELLIKAVKIGLCKVEAWVMVEHMAGIRCFEKLGFEKEGILPKWVKDSEGRKQDLLIMSIMM